MRKALVIITALFLLWPFAAVAQDGKAALENVAKAMGAAGLKSIEYSASGESFMVGQSLVPGSPWPKLTVKSQTRAINYETASLRTEQIVNRATDLRGGGAYTVGDVKQILVISGDHAWTVTGETLAPQPRLRTEQQLQLWTSPHGVIKAAMANKAKVDGKTISFSVPARFNVKATTNNQN